DLVSAEARDQPARAREDLRFAEAARHRIGGDARIEAQTLSLLGNIDREQGRFDDAIADFRRAFALREARLGDDRLGLVEPLSGMANVYVATGRYDEAE